MINNTKQANTTNDVKEKSDNLGQNARYNILKNDSFLGSPDPSCLIP